MNAIRQLIQDEGGVEFAQEKIQSLSEEAQEDLSIFPDTIYKNTLLSVLSFNSERMK
jgi:geranylgeranyl pyrophosphate synthase